MISSSVSLCVCLCVCVWFRRPTLPLPPGLHTPVPAAVPAAVPLHKLYSMPTAPDKEMVTGTAG